MSDHNAIPCDGCTQCCKNDQVILRPEDGDDLSLYLWEPIESALYPGQPVPALMRNKQTGHCIYLTGQGCSIHPTRPAICRRFHCARMFKALKEIAPEVRDALWARGDVLDKTVIERGRNRFRLARKMALDHTLDIDKQIAAFAWIVAHAPPR